MDGYYATALSGSNDGFNV